jgi:hypothetical protein
MKSKNPFIALFHSLTECETCDSKVSAKWVEESWRELTKTTDPEKPVAAVMAALLLFDDRFQMLITEEECDQLVAIVGQAMEEYHRHINPTHHTGCKLADAIHPERQSI